METSPWDENPFFVLGIGTSATRAEVEREGQKLLALLAIGSSAVSDYVTPLGTRKRTEDRVRWALAELRDPAKRALHAPWALGPLSPPRESPPPEWPNALRACGFRRG